jgi:hypothetical protein
MPSFSLDFPDELVFDILGDDLEVTAPGQQMVIVKAPFETINDEDELARRMAANEPTIPIKATDAGHFVKGTLVAFNGVTYSFHSKHREDANLYMVTLRTEVKKF